MLRDESNDFDKLREGIWTLFERLDHPGQGTCVHIVVPKSGTKWYVGKVLAWRKAGKKFAPGPMTRACEHAVGTVGEAQKGKVGEREFHHPKHKPWRPQGIKSIRLVPIATEEDIRAGELEEFRIAKETPPANTRSKAILRKEAWREIAQRLRTTIRPHRWRRPLPTVTDSVRRNFWESQQDRQAAFGGWWRPMKAKKERDEEKAKVHSIDANFDVGRCWAQDLRRGTYWQQD